MDFNLNLILLLIMAVLIGLLLPRLMMLRKKKSDPNIRILDEGWQKEGEQKFDEALQLYRKAERHYRTDAANKAGLAKAVFLQALLYKRLKDYGKAEEYLSESMELCRSINDEESLGHAFVKLAETHEEQKHYKRAMNEYEKAAELFEKLGLKRHIAYARYRVALSAAAAGHRKTAVDNFGIALNKYRGLEELDKLADILIEAGDALWDLGEAGAATETMEEALRYLKRTGPKEKAVALRARLETRTRDIPVPN
ncbi:MAG: tetratricopeptide repeat protein [Clostridiales Family XIII bacterium]|nr:tetratricopeptide repeat protein [Clostridiales Family XIII bacterium]